ncbi:class I SAM-dependent methyltransferase [Desulfovibrio sp. UIB00]|uniref:class I SAM-dependent methyltransferase n=1 Tax=Desulfovibrio sp. UIB00 TaxID=2804314 RepID=UPI001F0E9356|nr:class I SAM-dependent methyltransferase [Desulfovibrio sp. UIB00]MCH5146137.1 class I SAM-dependent methyltransferase [Desulfovibrio sp. UIB00]
MSTYLQQLMSLAHYQRFEEKQLVNLFAERFSSASVLDVGCGLGKYLSILGRMGCKVTGVDSNPRQVSQLVEQGYNVFTPDKFPRTESYDVILMSHLIEHMDLASLTACINSYLELLKPDGKLIIISPVLGERFYYDPTHVRPYYPQSIRMLMGNLLAPAQQRSKWVMYLEDIWFFNDCWRLRGSRHFYPQRRQNVIAQLLVASINLFFVGLYLGTGGRLGAKASWMGIYGKRHEFSSDV